MAIAFVHLSDIDTKDIGRTCSPDFLQIFRSAF